MSYILEALKKIEQKQQREGAPKILSIPPDLQEEEKEKPVLAYLIVGALILNACLMAVWWMVPRRHQEKVSSVAGSISVQEQAVPKGQVPLSPVEVPVPVRRSAIAEPQAPKPAEEPKHGTIETTSGREVKTPSPTVMREAQPRRERLSPSSVIPGGRLLSLEELPASVRSNLPEFKISGHAYSTEPRFRVARVNNKIVQEGEAVSQGLKVDEIVPGGVIFTYHGYRFRVGLNENSQ